MNDNKNGYTCYDFVGGILTDHANCAANILREARKANGMTQQQVADKANISLRHYQKFECGDRKITNASFCIAMAVIEALMLNPEIFIYIGEQIIADKVKPNVS